MTDEAPIIFCHYGVSPYLQYSLACAKLNCPNKEVILLGDEANRPLAEKLGVLHHAFSEYDCGSLLDEFDAVYKEVRGSENKSPSHWINFVFRRWFFVANFIEQQDIHRFWHFDSDTMIVDDLASHEHKFDNCDCTEQCGSGCLNGFITNQQAVLGYVRKVNELFQRPDYLEAQRERYDRENPLCAFTEMDAYATYRDENDISSVWLGKPIEGSIFDDCICQEHGMEMEHLKSRHRVKKIFLGTDGRFFCVDDASKELVQINTLNLSWVPLCTFKNVLNHSRKRKPGHTTEPVVANMRRLSDMPMPWRLVLRGRSRKARYALKSILGRVTGKKAKSATAIH